MIYCKFVNHCYICNEYFSNKPFENMNAVGESTISKIVLYDEEHILCPKCTNKLNIWINENSKK